MAPEELTAKVDAYLAGRPGPRRALADLLGNRAAAADSAAEGRDVSIIVVGTGRDPGLERMVDFLADRANLGITVVTFSVFVVAGGQRLLIRELTEADESPARDEPTPTIAKVLEWADAVGIGPDFRYAFDRLAAIGLAHHPSKRAIVFTPAGRPRRTFITLDSRTTRNGHMSVYVSADTIEEYLGVPAPQVVAALGGNEWIELPTPRPREFAHAAAALLAPAVAQS